MKAIGIDIGTTSICGVVLDSENGDVVRTRTELSDSFIKTENEWEKIQDVAKITDIAVAILDSFIDEFQDEICSIGLTGQMHGIVYTDENGKAVSPLYTWQDGRGNLPYKDGTYASYLGSYTGYGNVTDFYNRENGIVPSNAISYCTVQDYLGMLLCNKTHPLIHASDAVSLGLYNVVNKSFDYPVNIDVTDGFELIGTYRNIPVSVAIGDNQASVFATLSDDGKTLINVGTGSQVSVVSDKVLTAENVECRPYVDGKYLIVGCALCGGRAYSLLKGFYSELLDAAQCKDVDVYAVMDEMLKSKNDTDLQVDTRFAGTRNNPEQRGSVLNISTENFTPQDLTLATLRGIIDELYAMYLLMGKKCSGIVGSGNGIRKNKALARIAESTFGGELCVPVYTEEAACGAALFALVACGKFLSVSDVQRLIKYN